MPRHDGSVTLRQMGEPTAFLNGQWIPAFAAAVPVGDAGFVLGITVAEQLRTFAGKIFRLDGHLDRLAHSLKIVGVDPGMPLDQLGRIGRGTGRSQSSLASPGGDLGLSIVVTPGGYPLFSPPRPPRQRDSPLLVDTKIGTVPPAGPQRPTVCLHTYRLPFHLWAEKYRTGQALATTGVEQVSARCWPAALKCRSRMHYYLADRRRPPSDPQARALLLDHGFRHRGVVCQLVDLSRRRRIDFAALVQNPARNQPVGGDLELAGRLGIPAGQRELTLDDVATADEVLLTSTTICVLPVTRLNGRPIGSGHPGAKFSRLLAAWSEMVGVDIAGQAEEQAALSRCEAASGSNPCIPFLFPHDQTSKQPPAVARD